MRIATIHWNDRETASLVLPDGLVPFPLLCQKLHTDWPADLLELLVSGQYEEILSWYNGEGMKLIHEGGLDDFVIPARKIEYAPLYRYPGKIWGIGLNYSNHAGELDASVPDMYPGSFMKPSTSVIGHGDFIKIPVISERTTAEAELGVIIGRKCKNIRPDRWLDYVAGFTSVIDMTAEDLLRMNTRFLTLSKAFDSFFSFGPVFVSADEVKDVLALEIKTVRNGKTVASGKVADMIYLPDFLVGFHSGIMTLMPGDIISTGTPGASPIGEGDILECHITGFPALTNRVFDLKKGK